MIEINKTSFDKVLERLGLKDVEINIEQGDNGLQVVRHQTGYTIFVEKEHQVYRGLLLLATQLRLGKEDDQLHEVPAYDDFGYMVDCSRNAVITKEASRTLIEDMALMGYSNYQLYMEDTYDVENQPYFGYFRGKYSVDELKEIEAISNSYGMGFVPCIQTLAHLSAFVKWQVRHVQELRDVDDILLIGSEKVYELIDGMFKTFSHLKTRVINIGMDEAYLIGLGQYLNINGYKKRSLIMCQHLEKVLDIAEKYGFKCSMWSDMFFQLLTTRKNYEGDLEIDDEIASYLERLKDRVQLIYWDYYQLTEESYTQKFNSHKQITDNIAFAGGAWKWTGYTPDNRYGLNIAPHANAAARKAGVKQVTITGWGDNGGECSQFSILPTLQCWGELVYKNDLSSWEENFETLYGLSVSEFLHIDALNYPPSNPGGASGINPHRYILYQDILCPLMDLHINHNEDSEYFSKSAQQLRDTMQRTKRFKYLFDTQQKLAQILHIKSSISNDIRRHYAENDKEALSVDSQTLFRLITLVKEFHYSYSKQWLKENKVFGLDTIDIRLGGLIKRIERACERLDQFVVGDIDVIEELEETLLPHNDFYKDYVATTANQWHLIATASTIYTT